MSNIKADNILADNLFKKNGVDRWFPTDAEGSLVNDGSGNLTWSSGGAAVVTENSTAFAGQVVVDSDGNTLYWDGLKYVYTNGQVLQNVFYRPLAGPTSVAAGTRETYLSTSFTPKSPNSQIEFVFRLNISPDGAPSGSPHCRLHLVLNGTDEVSQNLIVAQSDWTVSMTTTQTVASWGTVARSVALDVQEVVGTDDLLALDGGSIQMREMIL